MPVSGKQRTSSFSYPAKPRISGMRALSARLAPQQNGTQPYGDKNKKYKSKKYPSISSAIRYDTNRKTLPDYTDFAYKEAVSKLRSMMTDTYTPGYKYRNHLPIQGAYKGEDSDEESGMSIMMSDRTRVARLTPHLKPNALPKSYSKNVVPVTEQEFLPSATATAPPELLGFIERQEEYIEQLEKESQYCRNELSQLLGKVKELITENEAFYEQQKSGTLRNVMDVRDDNRVDISSNNVTFRPPLEGPNIVFESRISELEAQLTQARLDLKKALDDAVTYKRKFMDNDPNSASSDFYRQLENLQREKRELNDTISKLQNNLSQMREKEAESCRKAQRTLDAVEKAQIERKQAEMEAQRLKVELEHQHERLLELISGQTRKVGEERSQAERYYNQHLEQLNAELASQRDSGTKLQLDFDKRLRIEEDLRRDLGAKNATIESLRKELNSKIANLQNELSASLVERDALAQEISSNKMSGERSERASRQEASRLQIEVTALRQRIERVDQELMLERRDNLRLNEQISAQEKEINLYKIKLGEMDISKDGGTKVTLQDLEGLVEKQSEAMTHLHQQCHSLTQQLQENSARHKQEMADLQSNLEYLTTKLEASSLDRQWQTEPSVQPTQNPYQQYQGDSTSYNPIGIEPATYAEDKLKTPKYDLQAVTSSSIDKPKSPSPKGRRDRPILSRSSSRGEAVERPSSREEKKKSPLKRRESRLQMQSPSEYTRPATYQLEESFKPPTMTEDPVFQPEQVAYQQSNLEGAGYEQVYQPPAYIPEETPYQTDLSQYEYQEPVYDVGADQDAYNYSDVQPKEDPYYQEAYKQEVTDLRNRTPSRESLRNVYEGQDTRQGNFRNRTPSKDSYEEITPQNLARNEARPRIPSSTDSIGPTAHSYASDPRAYSPSQQTYSHPQLQQDLGQKLQPQSTSNESLGRGYYGTEDNRSVKQYSSTESTGAMEERPKLPSSTTKRDSNIKPQQTKPQQRNTPTKF